MQQVQASLLPFHLHRRTIEVPNGLTLYEMVDAVFPKKNIPGIRIVVNIGDQVIPYSKWKNIRPKPHTVVGINAVAAGGKGGKKNPLATLIAIAVVVAAPYVAAAVAPAASAAVAAGTATFGQTLTVAAIKLGVGMVGFLATSMLSSVPKQRPQAAPSPSESTTQFIEGASNSINRYGPIPVNLGVNRMFPPQAALPYTETVGNRQYVRQLFTYGFGKVHISDRKIGETALSEYEGVEIVDRLAGNLNTGTGLYSNDVVQDGYSVTVSAAAGYITRTTQDNVDEAQIDITFSSGLTQYNDQAQRLNRTVSFEIRYALAGTTDWINRAADVSYGSQSAAAAFPSAWSSVAGKRIGYGILVLNLTNGVVSAVSYDFGSSPIVPPNCIRIASFRTESTSAVVSGGTANIYNLIDERAEYVGTYIANSTDFAFTYGGTGLSISVAAGTVKGTNNGVTNITVTDATAQALRITKSLKFPTRDQYDIQIKRLTADSTSDQIRDVATLTAIRSIRYSAPVNQEDISGTGMRVLATDQLNGTIDRYNAIVSTLIKDYSSDLGAWVEDVISSNPASIYRYVLQASGFIKALPDNRIDLDKLEEWHAFCKLHNLTYNRIIDQPISIDDLLNDIAAAGMATPHKINGNYSVLIDNDRPDIKGMVTPRNSWGYNGSITYPDLPHALRVQFRNKAKGYIVDERIVYADGYNESNATLYERLQFDSCTDSDLAWFYGRIYMASALLQPEVHNWNMDFENLTFNRGDKIVFVNDVILVGVGQARIKELIYDDPDTPTEVTGFILDEQISIPTVDNFGVRIRHGNGSGGFTYHGLTTTVGDTDEFVFTTPIPVASAPPLDSLCAFTQFGQELELVITEIRMNKDHSASITAVNYAPERYDAISGAIPPFDSNITLPANFYRPLPPELAGEIQSDETVMLKNSDGSFITRMIIPLKNVNEPSVQTVIRARTTGATQYFRPDILSATPEQVIITGLEDGTPYDFLVYYQRPGGLELLSQPLVLNNVTYQGAFAKPDDVRDFQLTVSDSLGLFQWTANDDIDLSHYTVRFSRATSGATWVSSQIVADKITTNRLTIPIQSGTYLIKAVDILQNESVNASIVISIDNGALGNIVETLTQHPTWNGAKVNVEVDGSDRIILTDPALPGYYYFDSNTLDLGEVYESILSSTIVAGGIFYDPGLSAKIRSLPSIRGTNSIRGTESSDWAVFLEFRKSIDGIDWDEDQNSPIYVKSVHPFEITIASGSTSNTATIPAVDKTRSIIIPGFSRGGDGSFSFNEDAADVTLTNGTTVTATTNTANSGSSRIVCGTVVEFDSAIVSRVQWGSITIAANTTSNTATLNALNTDFSAPINLGSTGAATGLEFATTYARLALTSPTQLTATRGGNDASNAVKVQYCVIEFVSGVVESIQPVSIQISATASESSKNQSINAVEPSNTMLLWGGFTIDTTASNDQRLLPRIHLADLDTVTATRELSSSTKCTVNASVVHFAPGVINKAQRGVDAIASGQTTFNETITAVDVDEAFVSNLGFGWNLFSTPMNSFYATAKLTSATNVALNRASSTSTAVNVSWEVIEFITEGWKPFIVGKHIFQYLDLRIRMVSYNPLVTPFASQGVVTVDMPDRIEKDAGVSCNNTTGATITYSVPFKNNPAVNITLQNGAVDDKIEFISKTNTGFQIKVYNATTAGYVNRTFDYTSAGYGRVIT